MRHIEKTVFISYRRANIPWALSIYQDLTQHGYDVFFDYQNINSGDFEKVILENIKARAHFIIILTPSALEKCKEPNDWLRREIKAAIDEERNIVPLMLEGFDFGSTSVAQILTGKLASLNSNNGLRIYADYFFEGMENLRKRYLNITLRDVSLRPLTAQAKEITKAQKTAASEATLVGIRQLIAQEWLERGYLFYKSANYDEALRCLNKAISLESQNAYSISIRGIMRRAKGDLDGAIGDFDKAIRLDPESAPTYYCRAIARSMNNDWEGALSDFDEAIRLDQENADFYMQRGLARSVYKDLKGAIEDFGDFIRRKPQDANGYEGRGLLRGMNNELIGALEDFEQAIKLRPDHAETYKNRGLVHRQRGDFDKAIVNYDEAISLKPNDSEAYHDRGQARAEKDDFDGAIADYNKAIRLQTDYALAYSSRGNARRAKGDTNGALTDYSEALRLQPDLATAFYDRGITYQLLFNHKRAVLDYQEAVQLEPTSGTYRSSLMSVLQKLGRTDEADEQEKLARTLIGKELEYNRACFETICGNTEKALELLKIAIERKQSPKGWLQLDPDFENLRVDPRFQELVRK